MHTLSASRPHDTVRRRTSHQVRARSSKTPFNQQDCLWKGLPSARVPECPSARVPECPSVPGEANPARSRLPSITLSVQSQTNCAYANLKVWLPDGMTSRARSRISRRCLRDGDSSDFGNIDRQGLAVRFVRDRIPFLDDDCMFGDRSEYT
jgi:hypothetical protein